MIETFRDRWSGRWYAYDTAFEGDMNPSPIGWGDTPDEAVADHDVQAGAVSARVTGVAA